MKTIFQFLFFFLFMLGAASAQLTDAQRAEISPKNLLAGKNPGFENGTSGWTASAGTFTKVTSGGNFIGVGKATGTWDASASTQTLTSPSVTVNNGLAGTNGVAICKLMTQGTASHTMSVTNGSTDLGTSSTIGLLAGIAKYEISTFIFGAASSTAAIKFTAAANEPLLSIDDCGIYAADGKVFKEISQVQFYGSQLIPGTANCSWSMATTQAWTSASADSDCPTPTLGGYANTTAGKIPGVSFPSLPPGKFKVTATFGEDAASVTRTCSWRLYDGTSGKGAVFNTIGAPADKTLVGWFEYSSPQGATTFQVQNYNVAPNDTCVLRNNILTGDFTINVEWWPLASQIATSVDSTPWYIDASIGGASLSLSTSDQSTPTTPNNASLTLTNATGAYPAWVTCSSTNPPTGTTCSAGSEETGLYFHLPKPGAVEFCAYFTEEIDTNAAGQIYTQWQWSETTSTSQTPTQTCGKVSGPAHDGAGGARDDNVYPVSVCSICKFDTNGFKTVRLQQTVEAASGVIQAHTIINGSPTSLGALNVKIIAKPVTEQSPMSSFVGAVTNSGTGAIRVETGRFNCDSASIISTGVYGNANGSSFMSAIGNISASRAGGCVITLTSGIFSAAPYCQLTNHKSSDDNGFMTHITVSSATSVIVDCDQHDGTDCTSFDGDLMCIGPR